MTVNIPLHMTQTQVRALREVLPTTAADVRHTADLVRECLHLQSRVRAVWESVLCDVFADGSLSPADVRQLRAALLVTFDETIDVSAEVVASAKGVEGRSGQSVPGLPDLETALIETRRFKERAFAHWPAFTVDDATEARARMVRGEGVPVEDAFAEMAGISRQELLRRLDEHRRKRASLGWE